MHREGFPEEVRCELVLKGAGGVTGGGKNLSMI